MNNSTLDLSHNKKKKEKEKMNDLYLHKCVYLARYFYTNKHILEIHSSYIQFTISLQAG